ncbi:hypothetical protein JY651_29495 [Pyxidicoccus parkwayensis]|uniref:Uncharacterized protein n=1 Tax=Pyxidicoccus parkwayensis TaxID=2813578 RepID=A0ABX7NLZ1_9BACT|nr:NusA N-terminal domain-containing protein [Pyxidicoccus parkwaysis]QSQ19446.1 hypothetical protein JY651_29495 [Pyxidicoccus parkwaysis]
MIHSALTHALTYACRGNRIRGGTAVPHSCADEVLGMSESDSVRAYFREYVEDVVNSGYWDEPFVLAFLGETIEYELGPEGETEFLALARQLLRKRRAKEARWAGPTENDALDQAFRALRERGILALQNAGETVEQGWKRAEEEAGLLGGSVRGVAFFAHEDVRRAVRGGELQLSAGALGASNDSEASLRVRQEVRDCLADHGLEARASGLPGGPIRLEPFPWRKRRWTHMVRDGSGRFVVRPNDAPFRFAPVLQALAGETGFPREAVVGALEAYMTERVREHHGAWRELDARYDPQQDRVDVYQVVFVVEHPGEPATARNQRTLAELERLGLEVAVGDELVFQIFYRLEDARSAGEQDRDYGPLLRLRTFGFSMPAPTDEMLRAGILARLRSAPKVEGP